MNVDEAIEEARQFGEQESKDMLFAEHIAILLAAEVERLRGEVERLDVARLLGTALEVERLRAELAASKANTEALKKDLYGLQAAAIRLGDRLDDAEKELAAVRAASVVPVEIQSVYVNKYLGSVVVFIGDEKGAVEFDAWLCDRVKERGER